MYRGFGNNGFSWETDNFLWPKIAQRTKIFPDKANPAYNECFPSPNWFFTEVLGSNGWVGDGCFVRYSRKSVTLDFSNAKSQFGDCQNVCYFQKSIISEFGTSENICNKSIGRAETFVISGIRFIPQGLVLKLNSFPCPQNSLWVGIRLNRVRYNRLTAYNNECFPLCQVIHYNASLLAGTSRMFKSSFQKILLSKTVIKLAGN